MTNGHWLVRRIDYSAVVSRNGYNNYEHFYHFFFHVGDSCNSKSKYSLESRQLI